MKYKKIFDDENIKRKKVAKQERPLHVSNVALIDPEYETPTRIKYGYLEDGTKVRISKKSGSIIPKPDRTNLKYVERTKNFKQGPLDTPKELVLEKTYEGEDFLRVKAEFETYITIKEETEKHLVFNE